MRFAKYHALGNDYIVMEADEVGGALTPMAISQICAQHFGIGADGILLRQVEIGDDQFQVSIFNSDGSEAEKSGNGLRIFARYLWDNQLVRDEPFEVLTPGGTVTCQVSEEGAVVSVDMGIVCFDSHEIPVTGPPREVIRESLTVGNQTFQYSAASIGNPHCVIPRDAVTKEEAQTWGPLIETESRFPNLTNVQFMKVIDRNNIEIEIWERGAGYTLASGTSSCAAAAVARRLDLCDPAVTVHMPGGRLSIEIAPDYSARMTGPVVKVADGRLCAEILDGDNLAARTVLG